MSIFVQNKEARALAQQSDDHSIEDLMTLRQHEGFNVTLWPGLRFGDHFKRRGPPKRCGRDLGF